MISYILPLSEEHKVKDLEPAII
ncbi:hypothetical protein EMIT0P43_50196 [Pseudomonas jessenii]